MRYEILTTKEELKQIIERIEQLGKGKWYIVHIEPTLNTRNDKKQTTTLNLFGSCEFLKGGA